MFVKLRVMELEILQPAIQPSEYVVQPLDEISPVASHSDTTEVLLDRGLHLVEVFGDVGLGIIGDVRHVGFRWLDVGWAGPDWVVE